MTENEVRRIIERERAERDTPILNILIGIFWVAVLCWFGSMAIDEYRAIKEDTRVIKAKLGIEDTAPRP